MKIRDKRVIKGLVTDCLGLGGTIKWFYFFGGGGETKVEKYATLMLANWLKRECLLLFSLCPKFF